MQVIDVYKTQKIAGIIGVCLSLFSFFLGIIYYPLSFSMSTLLHTYFIVYTIISALSIKYNDAVFRILQVTILMVEGIICLVVNKGYSPVPVLLFATAFILLHLYGMFDRYFVLKLVIVLVIIIVSSVSGISDPSQFVLKDQVIVLAGLIGTNLLIRWVVGVYETLLIRERREKEKYLEYVDDLIDISRKVLPYKEIDSNV